LYDQVLDAYLPDNTDAQHPMFVMLHHDGDNFGGGSEGYYHHNFQNFVNWIANDPDYEASTVDDYLDRFPVDQNDVIHIEDGSWAGADSGDPEFKKWLGGDVSAGAVSPDINSWAALTQARNHLATIDAFDPVDPNNLGHLTQIMSSTGGLKYEAWRMMLVGQASDYWYWDGTEVWDSNPTRAANAVITMIEDAYADTTIADVVGPTIFPPQREPYNPGGIEFGSTPQPSDFEVWTLVGERAAITSVTLHWRVDNDGENPIASIQNETFAGGPEVGAWNSIAMTAADVPTPAGVLPAVRKAKRYGATIAGQSEVLIDYYVEAADNGGNVSKSDIMHVWVGTNSTAGGDAVVVDPDPVQAGQQVMVSYDPSGGPIAGASSVFIHYGFDNWASVLPDLQMSDTDSDGVYEASIAVPATATQFDLVFNDGNNNWDNNSGQDWHFTVEGGSVGTQFVIDGTLDPGVTLVDSNNGIQLWAGFNGTQLYMACTPAGNGEDRFLVLAQNPGAMQQAMWAKAGQVAAWDAFIGNENDNNFVGWFDQSGATQLASGSVLEGTIDLAGELGVVPETVHLAVLSYASPDGSTLNMTKQVPATQDGDGNVEPNEFALIELCSLTGDGCCPADFTGDGVLDVFDVFAFLDAFNAGDAAADITGDGVFDIFDVFGYLDAFTAGCP
ncbi:MAG: hypothetical protein KC996_01050, partial [Phycisphaerales bacterium]|nr:hypothetical protein [Phycisphaerales bacterium]